MILFKLRIGIRNKPGWESKEEEFEQRDTMIQILK